MKKTIVCRCEDVLLEEIEEAIDGGHEDVESLKRFTGFGTGVCQGKSCIRHVGALLDSRFGSEHLSPFTPRPPVSPIPLRLLASPDGGDE